MNKTTEQLLQQLNTMQSEHIKVLNERIKRNKIQLEVLKQTIEIDQITIQTQEKTIKLYIDNLNSKSNE